ncbi:DUF4007 family protein [Candidatus Poriferisodalis sp.]|uniref:DUF4007 family protein n=1 Tax=Candidatus Poriferisodalis sp. TaxID=3101277 RepID=UPI003B016BC0
MRLSEAAEPVFARHETFHPRFGWFRKAYAAAARDPHVFASEDAPVQLGVGKNMVRSIRFWGLASKVLTEVPDPAAPSSGRKPKLVVPTRFGEALFGAGGWDPWMEDPGTHWLLHWRLLAPPCRLPVWWLSLCEFGAVEFEAEDLATSVTTQLRSVPGWKVPSESAVHKDVTAFVRTYGPATRSSRESLDDAADCPLRLLRLVGRSEASGAHRYQLGPKPTLPGAVAAHAVLDWVARAGLGGQTATLERLAAERGSPADVFKLSAADLFAVLVPAVESMRSLDIATPVGVPQLAWRGDPGEIAAELLSLHYGRTSSDSAAGPSGDEAAAFGDESNAGAATPDVLTRLDSFQARRDTAQAGRRRVPDMERMR